MGHRTVYVAKHAVTYYEDGQYIGTIKYSDKSKYYVDSAVNNWFNGVLDVKTVKKYSK